MGSDAHVVVVGADSSLADAARARIEELEGLWSRFRPESEVSRLNRHAGSFVPISRETALLLGRAIEGAQLSGGAFDATQLDAIVASGYDRDYEELLALSRDEGGLLSPEFVGNRGTCDPIEVREATARLRSGVGFDPGGIGKGAAADLVVAELLAEGAAGACVNLGGDLRVAGESPEGDGWTIAIEHPWSAQPVALVGVATGGVASSTTLKRRWLVGKSWRHHLIDPRTGLPSDSDLTHATVIAGEAWTAEVLAKAVLLNGSDLAFNILGGTGAESLIVDEQGRVSATNGFGAFLGGAELPANVLRSRFQAAAQGAS